MCRQRYASALREHEKLSIYPKLLAAAREVEMIARRIPDSHGDLRAQLRSASNSVSLNLGEGANEFSPSEKARFYRIARRSTGECLVALDLCDVTLPAPPSTTEARALLDEISAFLTTLINAQRRRQIEARRKVP